MEQPPNHVILHPVTQMSAGLLNIQCSRNSVTVQVLPNSTSDARISTPTQVLVSVYCR